jgi:molybdenum cofactor cytidylyltransferase
MIAAIVPAAGASVRMGRPKLLLEIGGRTVIARVVESLRKGGTELVIVVTPPVADSVSSKLNDESIAAGAETINPSSQPTDMRASIELAIDYLAGHEQKPDLVLLCPADSPGISSILVAKLVDRAGASPGSIVIPVAGDERGHPIVLPWQLAREIPAVPTGLGVNALVARHANRVVECTVEDSTVIADLDTPEDYERWRGPVEVEGRTCK